MGRTHPAGHQDTGNSVAADAPAGTNLSLRLKTFFAASSGRGGGETTSDRCRLASPRRSRWHRESCRLPPLSSEGPAGRLRSGGSVGGPVRLGIVGTTIAHRSAQSTIPAVWCLVLSFQAATRWLDTTDNVSGRSAANLSLYVIRCSNINVVLEVIDFGISWVLWTAKRGNANPKNL